MKLTLTQLRANLYNIVDEVITKGTPIELERKGRTVKITLAESHNKLTRLRPHKNVINCNPDELIHNDWSLFWQEEKKL